LWFFIGITFTGYVVWLLIICSAAAAMNCCEATISKNLLWFSIGITFTAYVVWLLIICSAAAAMIGREKK
jgi:hypothetical protein